VALEIGSSALSLEDVERVVRNREKVVDFLDVDRPLFPNHNAMAEAVAKGAVLSAVQTAVGALERSWD